MTTYTESYLLGIAEGRALLKASGSFTTVGMRSLADNCATLMRGASATMRDVYKGERDFWRNQTKGSK